MDNVKIWCDGRVKTNPGLSGWAALLDCNGTRKLVYGNAGNERLTNNQAQIEVVIFALNHLKRACAVEIVTDSQYVANVGNGLWAAKNNDDEWSRLEDAAFIHTVIFKWMKELTTPEQQIVRTKALSMFGKVVSGKS